MDDAMTKKIQELQDRLEKERSLGWLRFFDERQQRLIANCRNYAQGDPAGMPGHNLALIVAKMAELLNDSWDDSLEGKWE